MIAFQRRCWKQVKVYEEIREMQGRLRLGGERREVLGRLTVVWERMEEHLEESAANRARYSSTYRRLHRCVDHGAVL